MIDLADMLHQYVFLLEQSVIAYACRDKIFAISCYSLSMS
jgi:hypothetical protein